MSTIKKIAERTGVSPSTVSRVLNNPNYHCANPKRRELIWKTAMELNYVPNEAARNLKMGVVQEEKKNWYINILVTRTETAGEDPFFTELLRVIETEIHNNLCVLSQVWYNSVFSDDRKCRITNLDRIISGLSEECEGKNDGLIIIGKCNRAALQKLNKQFKHVVSVNRNSTNREVDEVTCDGRKVAAMALEYLMSLGHREIGYVGECRNEARYRGYLETMRAHDIEPEPSYIVETRQTEPEGYEAMKYFMKLKHPPTGIYCANDITAVGMLKCLNKFRNRYISISIISSDDIEEAQHTVPMLSTVSLPKEEMGKFALYLLLDRIKKGHKNVVTMELEGKLVKRGSCQNVSDNLWNDYCI